MSDDRDRLALRAAGATDRGRLRSNNQDSYMLLPDRGIYVVADGMGGAHGGEVASRMAIEIIEERYQESGVDSLSAVIAEANHRIHEAASTLNLRGMGTTTVVLAVVPGTSDQRDDEPNGDAPAQLLVANVGDSRAYLFRDGGLTQLTDDHSVVAELVRDGRITATEAEAHPQRNVITRVLGVYPQVTPDLWPIDPVRGDRFLLCSDGLFNEVSDDRMAAVLRRLVDPAEAAAELVRVANDGGGRDNITVIVVDVVSDDGVADRASAALAGSASSESRALNDIAGFSTASARAATPKASGRQRRVRGAMGRATRPVRTRLTWRVLLFTVLLAAVIGGAFATIQWYGTSTYYVGFDRDEVSIFRGRPGGLLWIDPVLEQDTAIKRSEVPARYLPALTAGHQHSSLADARAYVSNIERDIIDQAPPSTTTTAPPSTTTAAS